MNRAWALMEKNPLVPRIERALENARAWGPSVGAGLALFLLAVLLLGRL